jgi:iron complex transport system substrate-binding protein
LWNGSEPMNGQRTSGWLAWLALLGLVAGMVVFAAVLMRRDRPSGASATQVEGESGWPRTLVERFPDGREARRVVLPAPPQRIVSVNLGTDQMLMDMIEPERIVALSDFARQPESLMADRVGSIKHFVVADAESIIGLEPDLCFLASYNREETRSLLIDTGIPVYVFRCFEGLDDIRNNMRTVGRAVGAEEEAERLVAEMDRKLADVARRLPPKDEWPSALVYGQSARVEGIGTTQTEVFEAAGLRNAAAELGIEGFGQVTEEQVLDMDPDYLVVVVRSQGMAHQKQWLLNNPALAPLTAIRNERFLTVDEPLLSAVTHHIADAVVTLARQVYPDRFANDHE